MRGYKNRIQGFVLYLAAAAGFVSFAMVLTVQVSILHDRVHLGTLQPPNDIGKASLRGQNRQFSASHLHPSFQRKLLPASVFATRKLPGMMLSNNGKTANPTLATNITSLLTPREADRALQLCGRLLFSTLQRAVRVNRDLAEDVYVATGDIDLMWVRDSVVQMTIYLRYMNAMPWLRLLVEGVVRRNAFNILQDPYANSYGRHWKDPTSLSPMDKVMGRGGFVTTRNYELDSGAYFMNHLYDYYVTEGLYKPELLLQEPIIFQAVNLLVEIWIVEQHHDTESPYRYFELTNQGRGEPTSFTGMTWSGFRPSDDPCQYGYLIPANIHAAAALERILILNERVWQHPELDRKATKLLKEIQEGINTYGMVKSKSGELIYAYEVDGQGGVLANFDDANVPSLLSIPLLGWTGYNTAVYQNTRNYLLSKANERYYEGTTFRGVGSPHTPDGYVWPMSMAVQGLTETGEDQAQSMVYQMRQLLLSATGNAIHESVHQDDKSMFTREWFEWVRHQLAEIVYLAFQYFESFIDTPSPAGQRSFCRVR